MIPKEVMMTAKAVFIGPEMVFDTITKRYHLKLDYYENPIIAQYPCRVHVLFCQNLVGNQHDRFMDKLKAELDRIVNDDATVQKEFEKYIKVYRKKYVRHRTVEYDADMIAQHKNKYAGHICFLTNDKTIQTAQDALLEYSTRDYIEKDFDEMKNNLDMKRIRVQTDNRMRARLFIQFIAEIYMREVRVRIAIQKLVES